MKEKTLNECKLLAQCIEIEDDGVVADDIDFLVCDPVDQGAVIAAAVMLKMNKVEDQIAWFKGLNKINKTPIGENYVASIFTGAKGFVSALRLENR